MRRLQQIQLLLTDEKVGVASGVYKMASSLGNAFGVAISSTVYSVLAAH